MPLAQLDGLDSLLSIVQMPGGVPVATVAVGNAENAGLLAVRILGTSDEKLRAAMEHYQADLAEQVHAKDAAVQERFSRRRAGVDARVTRSRSRRSMSSLAARRAGRIAATTPDTPANSTMMTSVPERRVERREALVVQRLDHAPPEEQRRSRPRAACPSSAMITDSHRIIERIWRRLIADRAQQPDLAGSLVDRQRHRVGDADERDDHREEQQHVDETERPG